MIKRMIVLLGLLCCFHQAMANEYDMYVELSKSTAAEASCSVKPKANILFLLDTSSSMSGGPLKALQMVLNELVTKLNGANIALMTFNTAGGAVVFPFSKDASVRDVDAVKSAIQGFVITSGTPITNAYHEAYRYYAGLGVLSGRSNNGGGGKVSVPSSYGNNGYLSPSTAAGQKNHIVFMSDGEPNNGIAAQFLDTRPMIASLTGKAGDWDESAVSLAGFMAAKKSITTHTIAFGGGEAILQKIAGAGKGKFFSAGNADALLEAFLKVLDGVIPPPPPPEYEEKISASVGVGVNEFNPLTTRNEIFFTLIKPSAGPRWQGNLRRYVLQDNPSRIEDSRGKNALDPKTGLFADGSRSFWSPEVDGMDVTKGGAVSQLPAPQARNLFTEGANKKLNALDGNNAALAGHMGDSIYSVPLTVTYGGTDDNPDMTVFLGTNEGFLHAIDAKSGKEQFAFMPQSLLKNIPTLKENVIVVPPIGVDPDEFKVTRPFGMDASPVVWRKDNNADVQIKAAEGDFVYLYSGMRRGGRDYFALDVTNRKSPELLWKITGGAGDFVALGQTWSTPVKTQIRLGDVRKDVLLFAGGYDPAVDEQPNVRVKASMGNAIYMVDAQNGQLIWMASNQVANGKGIRLAAMQYAIPANLEVVDMDRDGVADQLYVGDLGGQIWRFDILNGNDKADTLVQGGVVARLADDSVANNRRFFAKPDVSQAAKAGSVSMMLAIGSGSLTEPLSAEVKDRFYVLDLPMRVPKMDYSALVPVSEADLVDRTNSFDTTKNIDKGWYIRLLEKGEKVLASSLTLDHQAIFTTFIPNEIPTSAACSSGSVKNVKPEPPGVGRYYVANVVNGNPIKNGNPGGVVNQRDRYHALQSGTMPGQPRVVFEDGGSAPSVLLGPEMPKVKTNIDASLQLIYWYKQPVP
jgi:type IV pilus assembly protein PilY1